MTLKLRNFARRQAGALGLTMATAFAVCACSGTVPLDPAADSNNPLCAEVTVRLPGTVSGEERRYTDAQATGAWGTPAAIILTCGVASPGPSELPCYTLGSVDWLALPQENDIQRAVTFGRNPAVEVVVQRSSNLDFATVLDELGQKIAIGIPDQSARCSSISIDPSS